MQWLDATISLGIAAQDGERVRYNYTRETTEPAKLSVDNHMVDELTIQAKKERVHQLPEENKLRVALEKQLQAKLEIK